MAIKITTKFVKEFGDLIRIANIPGFKYWLNSKGLPIIKDGPEQEELSRAEDFWEYKKENETSD